MLTDGDPRAVVVAGHELYRQALRAALEAEAGMTVVGSAANVASALEQVETCRPELVALTTNLAGGVAGACRAIKESSEVTRVLVVDRTPDPAALLASLEAGADGYTGEDVGLAGLADAACRVHAGESVIPEGMLGMLLRTLIRRRREDDAALALFNRLSRREQEVLRLMVEGLDHQQIAAELIVSPHTARTHIQRVLEKLGVHSRLEATRFALDHDLLERFPVPSSTGDV